MRSRPGSTTVLAIVAIVSIVPRGDGASALAQERPPPPPPEAVRQDSILQPIDTADARSLGLPTAPSRSFPSADSVIRALMDLPEYAITRYAGDSITLFGQTREIVLVGSAMVEREGSTLEAGVVSFQQSECRLLAGGDPEPTLFDAGTVLVGKNMRYDTCERRGTVPNALTSFAQGSATWYLRGGLEMDSAGTRIYGQKDEITSCEHPSPHYHITAGNVKWVSNTIMVARPAILYVRDVPILWLPFIFQDARPGRKSGMLIPRFGFNDLVRPNSDYRRHVSNIGYYFAISDYVDFQASLDWFSGNYIGINGQFNYRWLNQFLQGGLSASWIFEEPIEDLPGGGDLPGGRSMRLQWNHNQSFSQRTRLTASVDYATSARVVQNNSVDPFLQTATLSSRLNFNKQFDWGTLAVGGSYTQDLSNELVTQSLPTISLTPSPVQLWSDATWSPSFSFSNQQLFNQVTNVRIPQQPGGGIELYDSLIADTRTSNMSFRTPFRVGRWNWANDISIVDFQTTRPRQPIEYPDPDNPADTITRFFGEEFRTEIDWNTGINLPILFGSTWKFQPTIGVRNTTGGAFLLRNQFTGGGFVAQGKRVALSASMSPTFFGFFPGLGPLSRIRHSFAPFMNWSYAPKATVPDDYARALDPTGKVNARESPTLHRISLGFSNTFEGKFKPEPGDTTSDPRQMRKIKLLSIQTSAFEYDFEKAKLEGLSGWVTSSMTNRFTSDLVPGFSLSMTHDLWDGQAGTDSAQFKPFLRAISARFTLSSSTFGSIIGLFTGGSGDLGVVEGPVGGTEAIGLEDPVQPTGTGMGRAGRLDPTYDPTASRGPRGRGLQAAVTYDDQKTREVVNADGTIRESIRNQTLGFAVQFSPTPNWSVSWNTQYNMTLNQFGQHVLRLDRNLHRWRATFAFLKAPNGNFAFNFFISLTDQPELKMQYDQRTVR